MQFSPLQLLEFAFEDVSIRHVPGFKADRRSAGLVTPPSALRMRAESGISTLAEDSNYSDYGLKFVLHVEPKEPKGAPYEADVAVQGTFRMHQMPDITDAKDLEKRALVNGVSLLYGLVRDMICTVTSRSVYGQMLLPTLNFASMASQAPEPTPLSAEAGTKGETKRRPGRKRVSA